jgi:hypothetical protein
MSIRKEWMSPVEDLAKQFRYHSPTPEQVARIGDLRHAAFNFAMALEMNVRPCADRTAAMRKIREALMTANAGIVLEPREEPEPPKG